MFTNAAFAIVFASMCLTDLSGQVSLRDAAFVPSGATTFSNLVTGAGLPVQALPPR